jgi:hypothetical protein
MMKQTKVLSGFTPRVLRWALFGFFLAGLGIPTPGSILVNDAEARVGRPATPTSVAGVARRTTRRTVHRHNYVHHHAGIAVGSYVAVLPSNCTKVITRGASYHVCDNVYYRPYYEGSEVVYRVVEHP